MRIPRIFLDQELTKNKTYILDKDSFHHLLVIKKKEGDKIEVFNSKGQFLEASISRINKKTCEIFSIGETKIQKKTKIARQNERGREDTANGLNSSRDQSGS